MSREQRGVVPVEPPVEDDEETDEETRTTAKPEPIGKVDASEGQKPVDDWAGGKR